MAHSAVGSPIASSGRRRQRIAKLAALAVMALVGTALLPPATSMAATAVGLGNAESFAVLGSATVTNTGPTVVNGDLGVSPGLEVTGFDVPGGPGIVNGDIYTGGAAGGPQSDALTAYNALSAQDCEFNLDSQELGNRSLVPGVYCLSSTAQLTGALTLNAEGDPDAVFIFRVPSALTTAPSSSVGFTNDFETCNVFWQVGSSATLDTGTDFVGTLITLTEAITVNNGATVSGRLISLGAAVTLNNNVITTPTCPLVDTTPVVIPPVVTTTTTTPVATTTTVDAAPTEDTTEDTTPVAATPVDTATVDTVDAPTVGGPTVPGLTASPGSPVVPGSPTRPALPYTGSNLMPAIFAVLAIVVGGTMVIGSARRIAVRSSES